MIYLDNASTTLIKPPQVAQAVLTAMQSLGNTARGAHGYSLDAAGTVYEAREKLAKLFNCKRADHVVFTANVTQALNTAITGVLKKGDHVISTDLEHNSVLRPLYRMQTEQGVAVDFVPADAHGNVDYADFERLIKPNTKAIVCTHASNLTGNMIDIQRVGEIARSFDTARAAYAHRFFDRNSGMVWAEDRPRGPAGEDTDLVHVNPNTFERARLQDFLKTGEESEIPYFVDETFDHLEGESGKSLMFRQYITMDIYFIVREFMTRLDSGVDETGIPAPDAAVSSTTRAMRDYCSLLVTEAVRARNSVSGNRHRDVVDLVISHIESNYADEDLSLQTLADLVHFSPSHLSVIFSQQTGETLSKYLINYRIGKAKEALCCTSKKSSQIAEETGYKDPHYFSYMFKKVTGMTPTQYREKVTGMTPTQYREKATGMTPTQYREKATGMASAQYREQDAESRTDDTLRQRG